MRHLSKPLKTFCVFHRFFAPRSNWLAGLCVSVHGMPGCREGKIGRRGSWIEMWLCCCQALPHELPFSFSTRTERRSVKGGWGGGRMKKRKGERERGSERDTLHLSSSGLIGVAKPIHISSGVPITQTPYTKPPLLLLLLIPCILPIKHSLSKLPVFRAESFIIMDGSGNDSLSQRL